MMDTVKEQTMTGRLMSHINPESHSNEMTHEGAHGLT
jgi:hypothetical protein